MLGGDGDDELIGGLEERRINGGPGNDDSSATDGNDRITGGEGNDELTGDAAATTICLAKVAMIDSSAMRTMEMHE